MKLIVDRIEEEIAVLEKEDMTHMYVKLCELPAGTKEGSVLIFDGTSYAVDTEEEEIRRKRMLELQSRLSKRSKKD